jgi:hypothetical protein
MLSKYDAAAPVNFVARLGTGRDGRIGIRRVGRAGDVVRRVARTLASGRIGRVGAAGC